jgi:ADP-ribose pyrophosphatase YjhB (NUDIX family)
MVREVEEETGLLVTPNTIELIDSFHDKIEAPEFHGIRIIYRTTLVGGNLRNEECGTTDAAQWFSRQECADVTLVDIARQGLKIAFSTE